MFEQELYVREKLNAIDRSAPQRPIPATHDAHGAIAAPVLRSAGRLLQRTGERLESWASPQAAETEAAELSLQRELR